MFTHTLSYLVSKASLSFTSVRNETWHNNIMAGKEKHRELERGVLYVRTPFSSEDFHLNVLIASQQTAKGLWHMLLSQPTATTPTARSLSLSLSLSPPPPFSIHFYYHGRFQNKQTGIHQLALSALRPLWTFLFAGKYLSILTMCHERAAALEPAAKTEALLNISVIAYSPGKLPAIRPTSFLKLR